MSGGENESQRCKPPNALGMLDGFAALGNLHAGQLCLRELMRLISKRIQCVKYILELSVEALPSRINV
jgi:hypothetical protein